MKKEQIAQKNDKNIIFCGRVTDFNSKKLLWNKQYNV